MSSHSGHGTFKLYIQLPKLVPTSHPGPYTFKIHTQLPRLILLYHPGPSPSSTLHWMCPPHLCGHTTLHCVHPPIVVHHKAVRMCGGSLRGMCRPSFLGPAMPLGRPCRACLPHITVEPLSSWPSLISLDSILLHLIMALALPCGSHIQHHHDTALVPQFN